MKPTEIKDIVTGVLSIIFLAMALGQYGRLEEFAKTEAAKSLRPKATLAFFPSGFEDR